MNLRMPICFCLATLLAPVSAHAQGTFQNLNFELANPVSVGNPAEPNAVTAASAFPGWELYAGNVQLTQVNFNDPDTGMTTVGLVGPNSPDFPAIDGNYSVLLQGGVTASGASISQTGVIPRSTESLLFDAQAQQGVGLQHILQVSIGGQIISFVALSTGPTYTEYGATISAWAGDSEPLTFTAPEVSVGLNNWTIDDISFSTQSIPEPSPLVLTGLGAFVFALYRRFAPKRP
jgi:hypothetical protein